MGGRIPYEIGDANVVKDPDAVAQVLASPITVVLVPAELAKQVPLLESDFHTLRRGDAGARFLHRRAAGWMTGWKLVSNAGSGLLFDCFAVLAAGWPEFFTREPRFAGLQWLPLQKGILHVRQPALLASKTPGTACVRAVTFCTHVTPAAKNFLVERLRGSARVG